MAMAWPRGFAPLTILAIGLLLGAALASEVLDDATPPDDTQPFLIDLHRESVPIHRRGQVVSYKTSYSGALHVGSPAQEFRVVFDTGSGHVILPAVECNSEACVRHRRYNMSASETASAVNSDGSLVLPGELCDQVTIGFGTGEVTGEFVRERVCLGIAEDLEESAPCVDMHVVTAVEMSTQPFKSFDFDGILGLGLSSLALTQNFSFFELIAKGGAGGSAGVSQFAVFLTEGENGEKSEIAFGGYNLARALDQLTWAPVALPELGYWQVNIIAVRVDGVELDVCKDGTCRGVVDTGTSHLGMPAPHDAEVAALLTRLAGPETSDCRLVAAPELQIEVPGRNLTLRPGSYMRRLPLREGVNVASKTGVSLPSGGGAAKGGAAAPSPPGAVAASLTRLRRKRPVAEEPGAEVPFYCRPRLMPVNMPAPLGPKLFLLGEPVLHQYYSVFDWRQQRVGFALAASDRNRAAATAAATVAPEPLIQ